jgi:hypothetical protein
MRYLSFPGGTEITALEARPDGRLVAPQGYLYLNAAEDRAIRYDTAGGYYAIDGAPVRMGNMALGNHPVHGSAYPGIWNLTSGAGGDYALLAHANNTLINTPTGGLIYLQVNNVNVGYVSSAGLTLATGKMLYFTVTGDRSLSYNGSNYVFANAAVTANGVTLTSDRAEKRTIRPVEGALERLRPLPVRRFNYRNEPPGAPERMGFLWDEVFTRLPEFAHAQEGPTGKVLRSVDYIGIFAMAVRAIQELADRVDRGPATPPNPPAG